MKKICLFITLIITLLTGCGQKEISNEDTFNIVTSFYPTYIFTQNIIRDIPNIKLENMSENHSGCLHDYHLTTKDMKKIENADVFIINGAGLETFLEKVYQRENLVVIDSSKNIEFIQGIYSEDPNEHTWLSITNAINQVKEIGETLASIDGKNAGKYLENTNNYIAELKALKEELQNNLSSLEKNIKIVTAHDAFPYFAKDFGIEIVDIVEKEEGKTPTQKEIKEIIENIRLQQVAGIFIEPDYSNKLVNTIADESECKVYILDSITSGNGNIDDYQQKMKKNIQIIMSSIK